MQTVLLDEPQVGAEETSAHAHRSLSPDASMNLLLRFKTASGPRTVIACSVPRQVAADIADVMKSLGQHADFIHRCSPLSISDRVMIKSFPLS